ncbi:hypothetical protein [Streptomyces sp. NPDC058252]|uniref:hypothetical protein n=1 Tax=Streptomyces sp. NPDC058252 TaxID=3346405 RepID=UPI0036E63771
MPKYVVKYTHHEEPGQKRAKTSQLPAETPAEVAQTVEKLLDADVTSKIEVRRTE